MKRIAAIIAITLFVTTATFVGNCYADAGTGGTGNTNCSNGGRSGNACDAGGFTWVYYRLAEDTSRYPDSFVFPTSSFGTEYTQGKSTVKCKEEKGFWMLAYDIRQDVEANAKNENGGKRTLKEYGLGQDLSNYGTTNSDWHRSIVNRGKGNWNTGYFNEAYNLPCTSDETVNCNGGMVAEEIGDRHFSSYISNFSGGISASEPKFSNIQWRYTAKNAHGQTGSRNLNYVKKVKAAVNVPDGAPQFDLGYNYKIFGTARRYGTSEDVKDDFLEVDDLWKKITYYDENGNQLKFDYGDGKGKIHNHPKTSDEAFNMVAYFCFDDEGDTLDYHATFSAKTEAYANGGWKSGNQVIEIDSDSYTVNFRHTIERTDTNDRGGVEERYWRWKTGQTGKNYWDSGHKTTLTKNGKKIDNDSKTVTDLKYGDEKKVCANIWYYTDVYVINNTAEYYSNRHEETEKACVTVKRKSPIVDPLITLNVWNNKDKVDADKVVDSHHIDEGNNRNHPNKIKITSPDGGYYLNVTRYAKRTNDGAGGEVSVSWSGTATGHDNTSGTESGITESSTKFLNNNGWSSYLKYGEEKTFCVSLTITYNGTTKKTGNYCVTLYRDPLKCTFGTTTKDVTYAAGENYARIGVINFTAKGKTSGDVSAVPESDYTWTGIEGTSISQVKKFIWARPGDQIGFKHEMCGGALYPMAVNKYSFTKNSNGTYSVGTRNTPTYSDFTFVVSGKMDRYTNLTTIEHTFDKKAGGTDGYLFGNEFSTPGTTAYSNTKTYTGHFSTSGFTGTDFLQYNNSTNTFNITKTAYSPSVPNNSNYSCFITGASAVSGKRYQINGKSNEDGHQCGILRSDVGGVIYQTITYNPVKFASSTATNTSTTRTVTAQVFTPYNYLIKPYVNNLSSGVVYLGETMTVGPGVYVQPRVNSGIPNGGTSGSATGGYATMTKPTERQSKIYRIRNGNKTQLSESPVTTGLIFNKDGNLNGATSDDDQINIELSDDGDTYQVGDQICVEVSYYPADSHDWPEHGTQDIITSNNPDPASKAGTSSQPAMYKTSSLARDKGTVTATACSTIAKRPTMSVESANAYSATKFDTSLFSKKFSTTGASYLFGSWSEYGVFGKVETGTGGKTSYFASGAALGYATNARTSSAVNSTRSNTDSTHTASSSITSSNRQCVFSTQTFVNIDSTGNCASSSDKINGTSASGYSNAMKDYFGKISTEKNTLSDQERGETVTVNDKNYVNLLKSDIKNHLASNSGVYEFKLNGNAYLNGAHSLPDDAGNNRTIVYNISGDLVIDGNINYEANQAKTSLNDNTGVVILAKNVWITGNPDYINAMIIADQVNTCKFDSEGAVSLSTLNSDRCNKQLVFDAPVMTKKIVLNRTYGGGKGESSIQRAEIFNLNMANYLWSFNQMQNYNQAVTTYSREMPSRY